MSRGGAVNQRRERWTEPAEAESGVCREKWMISDWMKAVDGGTAIYQGEKSAASCWRGRMTRRDTAAGEPSIIHGPRAKKRPLLIIISFAEKQRRGPRASVNAAGGARGCSASKELKCRGWRGWWW